MPPLDFMDASPYAHIAYTLDYTVLAQNRHHVAMTGKPQADVVGRNLFDVFPPNPDDPSSDARPALQASLDRMVESGSPDVMETVKHDITNADGSFEERFWQVTHSPIWSGSGGTGEIIGALQTSRDVTAEFAHRRIYEAQRRSAMDGGEVIFLDLDLTDGTLDRAPALDKMFGFQPGEAGDNIQAFVDRIHPEDRARVEQQLADASSFTPHTHVRIDCRVILPKGGMAWVAGRMETVEATPTGGSRRLTGIALDITDLRRSEAKLLETLEVRDELVAQKELLLHEVNHRIKNSLQLVSSILMMDARSAEGMTQKRLKRAASRVRAVASVHALIYRAGQVSTVELEDYLVDLCRSLEASGSATVACQSAPVRILTDKAISIALLINELVSNAFEHGFAERTDGHVDVTTVREKNAMVLTVSDNGSGKTGETKPGLGGRIVKAIVMQLDGVLEEGPAHAAADTEAGLGSGHKTSIRIPLAT